MSEPSLPFAAPTVTPSRSILVIEDEPTIADAVALRLRSEGFAVDIAADGPAGVEACERLAPDLVVLDLMLPGLDGLEVCRRIQRARAVPVLMLTARGRPEDVLKGFAAGADDYLPKPFDLSILLARLHGLLRRMAWHSPPSRAEISSDELEKFEFSGRCIDFEALELTADNKTIHLTLMEADFLRYLVRNQGRIISRKELLEQVWRVREDTDTRAIDNFVVRLRRYLEDEPTNPVYLKTVRGIGYRFLPQGE